jgi:hypothetical protein
VFGQTVLSARNHLGLLSLGVLFAGVARMVSFEHQVVIELVRDRGELLREVLPEGHPRKALSLTSASTSADLSLVPKQYLADQLTLYQDEAGALCFAILTEVQREEDEMKEWTWPVYLSVARFQHRCPVLLLVFALKRKVERWARALINRDLPSWGEAPVVISARDIPLLDTPQQIRKNPQLAVLSVMAHPSLKLAEIVLKTFRGCLKEDRYPLYCEAVMRALSRRDRSALEAKMMIKGINYKTAFALKYLNEGLEKGIAKGRKEGARVLQRTARELARLKLDRFTRKEQATLRAVEDPGVLSGLILQLAKAKKPEQARTALVRAARREERQTSAA